MDPVPLFQRNCPTESKEQRVKATEAWLDHCYINIAEVLTAEPGKHFQGLTSKVKVTLP